MQHQETEPSVADWCVGRD